VVRTLGMERSEEGECWEQQQHETERGDP